jgi:hypothetical protein
MRKIPPKGGEGSAVRFYMAALPDASDDKKSSSACRSARRIDVLGCKKHIPVLPLDRRRMDPCNMPC